MSDIGIKSSLNVNPSVAGQTANRIGSADGKGKDSFQATLEGQIANLDRAATKVDQAKAAEAEKVKPATLKFSNHAVERMNQRGIAFTPDQMSKIENAARTAAQKGAKETLILADDSALIVNLKNNAIVTVMDKNMLRDNVFTNIDSTVII